MKQVNLAGNSMSEWKTSLESIGFVFAETQHIGGNDHDIYRWPYMGDGVSDSSYIGITLRQAQYGGANVDSGRLFDFHLNEVFDASLWSFGEVHTAARNTNAIRYEYLKNGGIVFTIQNLTTSPWRFAAFLPGENGEHGYVVDNTAIAGQIARIYNDGNLDRTEILNFDNTIKTNTNASSIQLVEAYDYINDNIISNLYLCVTNPNIQKCSVAGCYQIIEVNNKRYFIIPVGDVASQAKLAFEIADSLPSNS